MKWWNLLQTNNDKWIDSILGILQTKHSKLFEGKVMTIPQLFGQGWWKFTSENYKSLNDETVNHRRKNEKLRLNFKFSSPQPNSICCRIQSERWIALAKFLRIEYQVVSFVPPTPSLLFISFISARHNWYKWTFYCSRRFSPDKNVNFNLSFFVFILQFSGPIYSNSVSVWVK